MTRRTPHPLEYGYYLSLSCFIAEIMEDLINEKKKTWWALSGVWVQPDLRDRIVDFVRERAERTELLASRLVGWIGIGASKFFDGKRRYGQVNEPNADVEIIVQRALEAFPEARPRIVSDNGPQFVAKDFKAFLRVKGMDRVRTSPYYPLSNGKRECWHKSLKSECIRPKTPLNLDEARRLVSAYVDHDNPHRLHSAIGYITPADKLAGRAPEILENRERKRSKARAQRAENRRLQSERPVGLVS